MSYQGSTVMKEDRDEAIPEFAPRLSDSEYGYICLTLDEVSDLLHPLEAHAFGYAPEGQRASAVVRRMRQWRDTCRKL